eukprot:Lithocolla_globosa_v1_NODE_10334_length_610_cov_1.726126.p1 type:complete len:169 gc:universal NODE_10334_length_610_cov_1.726126:53-559(+)
MVLSLPLFFQKRKTHNFFYDYYYHYFSLNLSRIQEILSVEPKLLAFITSCWFINGKSRPSNWYKKFLTSMDVMTSHNPSHANTKYSSLPSSVYCFKSGSLVINCLYLILPKALLTARAPITLSLSTKPPLSWIFWVSPGSLALCKGRQQSIISVCRIKTASVSPAQAT